MAVSAAGGVVESGECRPEVSGLAGVRAAGGRRDPMPTQPSCIFCRIIACQAEASLLYHDDQVTAFLDAHPLAPGHLLVVPNRHSPDLAGLDQADGGRMFSVGHRLTHALRTSNLHCEAVNWFLADGAAAGQTVFHIHLHVIPRRAGDGLGLRQPLGLGRLARRADLEATAETIRSAIAAGPA